jgi:hypothetical protein
MFSIEQSDFHYIGLEFSFKIIEGFFLSFAAVVHEILYFLLYPLNDYYYFEQLLIFVCLFSSKAFHWILINSRCFLEFLECEIILIISNDCLSLPFL